MPIIITALEDGFRRCGVAHSKEAQEHADDVFSAAQLAMLQAEPMLLVEVTSAPEPDPTEAKPPAKKPRRAKAEEKPATGGKPSPANGQ